MKNNLKKLFTLLSLTTTLLTINGIASAEGDSRFIKFALDQAHESGFKSCDQAISSIFENAGGRDIRVNAGAIPDLKTDTIRLTAVFGDKGDAVFIDAGIRKIGPKCYTNETTTVTTPKSCVEYMSEYPAFKFAAETVGTIWTKNNGGVVAIYSPVGNACTVTYIKSRTF